MNVKRISLTGFRNYEFEAVDFKEGINVITGNNAQGKTNLIEAVYLLAYGKSFRSKTDREIINFDYSSATLLADIESHGRDQTISIEMKPGVTKKILVNGVKRTSSELSNTMNAVLFCPDDLDLIKSGAAERRKFLNNAIGQLKPQYSEYITEYNRLYEHKLRILKDWHEKPSLLDTIDEFSDSLCRCSSHIIRYRASYIKKLAEASKSIHSEFTENAEDLEIRYKTVSTVTDPFASEKEIYYEVLKHFENHRNAEIESCQCLTGAHKDDIEILINGQSARLYASQGQTRTAALSLKLAEREILLEKTGEYPILLLDDVLSELDPKRQEFVLNRIGGGQTFISCCEDENISSRTGGTVFFVEKGAVKKCI